MLHILYNICTHCTYLHTIYLLLYVCVSYSRTLAPVATVICWLYPTLNKSYLIVYNIYLLQLSIHLLHDDVIKCKHFPRYCPFVRGIHRSPVNSPHKGQWRGTLMFSLMCARINGWVNNREAGNLRRHRAHYNVTVMQAQKSLSVQNFKKIGLNEFFREQGAASM